MSEGSKTPSGGDDAQQSLAAVNRELEAKLAELAQANLELYETARQKSEFVANMSHELRTPLNSIIGFADVLLSQTKDNATPDELKYLQNIRRAGYRLLEIISELMTFARIEAGTARANVGPVFVPGLVSEVVTNVRNGLRKEIKIVTDLPAGMPTVMTDEVKLSGILQNLVSNAVKFTPVGGSVTVKARLDATRVDATRPDATALDSGTLTLSVADTGPGIAQKDQEAIFKRFHQLDSGAARRYEGVGLGLYLVDALVKILRGRVTLESAPARGATFTVTIPVEVLET